MERPEPIAGIKVIAKPTDFKPSMPDLNVVGAFNMGAALFPENGLETVVGMIRIAESPSANPPGSILFPFAVVEKYGVKEYKVAFEQKGLSGIIEDTLTPNAAKVREVSMEGGWRFKNVWRLRHISHPIIGKSTDGENFQWEKSPSFFPSWPHEIYGIEDIRIVKTDGTYILTSTSPDIDQGVSTSFAITADFKHFTRMPLPTNKDNTPRPLFNRRKNVIPLPERVNHPYLTNAFGQPKKVWATLVRENAYSENSPPCVDIELSDDFLHWGMPHTIMRADDSEDTIGGGTNLERGVVNKKRVFWGFYHYVKNDIYKAGLFAIDAANPWELVARTEPFMEPNQHEFGRTGFKPDVVYPTALILKEDVALVYSGENDTWTTLREYKIGDCISALNNSC